MKNITISQIDTLFVNGSYPIEFLLYYNKRLQTKKIRSVLKKLSSQFWPVFGLYNAGKIFSHIYIEQEIFEEDIRQQNFDVNQSSEIYENHSQSIPSEINRLFYLKIIQYKNGTVLIPRMNHLVGDGYSYFYFLSMLAPLSQNNLVPFKNFILRHTFKPHHNRTILKPFLFTGDGADSLPKIKKPILEYEYISKNLIQNQIKLIDRELNQSVSTNDILCAMVIKKTLGIHSGKFMENFYLSIPIDIRHQIEQYGPRFFGNGLLFHKISFNIHEIIKADIKELAVRIRQNMPQITKENYIQYLIQIEDLVQNKHKELLRPYNPENGCLVTNLSKLPTHKLDFGRGNPDLVFLLTIGKNSAAILSNKEHFILRYVY